MQKTGKSLPINVDGAIAAILVDLRMPRELANGFFIMARVPGLMAHINEEKSRMRPMRRIHPTDHEYDGPPSRSIAD
ncbi:MAG: citryl-CoA lyase, partial [Ardenticatenales bacterium]|nr:citryl-CoA lyase [Ardenticatenales bacterium]